jgi:single-stranded DNA-binding protein
MDINKVWVSGLAVTQPVLTKLQSRTQFASFVLQVQERFQDKNGRACIRTNNFRIEGLGRAAELVMDRVREGLRYVVDGYLRYDDRDGHEDIRIRAFTITRDDSADDALFSDGLRQALDVLKKSRDLSAATQSLEDLLQVR